MWQVRRALEHAARAYNKVQSRGRQPPLFTRLVMDWLFQTEMRAPHAPVASEAGAATLDDRQP